MSASPLVGNLEGCCNLSQALVLTPTPALTSALTLALALTLPFSSPHYPNPGGAAGRVWRLSQAAGRMPAGDEGWAQGCLW